MEQKDPKDMTASEQLRWAANGEPYNGIDENIWTYPTGKIRALAEAVTGEWPSDNEIFSIVADKIDAELAEARELSLLRGAEIWAKANGWPDFRDGEDFGAWLDRCAIPRPFDESGDPWLIGDRVIAGYHGETTVTGYSFNGLEMFLRLRKHGIDNAAAYSAQYCQRPAPEVLGADGKPIVVGETVYPTYGFYAVTSGKVVSVEHQDNVRVELCCSTERFDGCYLTHTPPDTQESIDRDARKGYMTYWECVECSCERCPARIDGDKPWRWYHADSCEGAMVLDLLRRQRELDARKGGAE